MNFKPTLVLNNGTKQTNQQPKNIMPTQAQKNPPGAAAVAVRIARAADAREVRQETKAIPALATEIASANEQGRFESGNESSSQGSRGRSQTRSSQGSGNRGEQGSSSRGQAGLLQARSPL